MIPRLFGTRLLLGPQGALADFTLIEVARCIAILCHVHTAITILISGFSLTFPLELCFDSAVRAHMNKVWSEHLVAR